MILARKYNLQSEVNKLEPNPYCKKSCHGRELLMLSKTKDASLGEGKVPEEESINQLKANSLSSLVALTLMARINVLRRKNIQGALNTSTKRLAFYFFPACLFVVCFWADLAHVFICRIWSMYLLSEKIVDTAGERDQVDFPGFC